MIFARWVSFPCVIKALIYKDFQLNQSFVRDINTTVSTCPVRVKNYHCHTHFNNYNILVRTKQTKHTNLSSVRKNSSHRARFLLFYLLFQVEKGLRVEKLGQGYIEPVAELFYCYDSGIAGFVVQDAFYCGLGNAGTIAQGVGRYFVLAAECFNPVRDCVSGVHFIALRKCCITK